jgi:hypothetical protein
MSKQESFMKTLLLSYAFEINDFSQATITEGATLVGIS